MFRYGKNRQIYKISEISEEANYKIPAIFYGIDAHGYKGYHYFTGSSFIADKQTFVSMGMGREHFRLKIELKNIDIKAFEQYKRDDFFASDNVVVNILTYDLKLWQFAVNPDGKTKEFLNGQETIVKSFISKSSFINECWILELEINSELTEILKNGFGLDIVRQEQTRPQISTMTRVETVPPYNLIYTNLVHSFSKIEFLKTYQLPPDPLHDWEVKLISPSKCFAGNLCDISINIKVGSSGLMKNGGLNLSHGEPVLDCAVSWTEPLDWGIVQSNNPSGDGYISINNTDFVIITNGIYTKLTYLGKEALPPYTILNLKIAKIRASIPADKNHLIKLCADAVGNSLFSPLPSLKLPVKPHQAVQLFATNPGAIPAGENFELIIRAADKYGNIAPYAKDLAIGISTDNHTFPSKIRLVNGVKVIKGKINDNGVYRFVVNSNKNLSCFSNFIATDESFGAKYILYGDMHCHTNFSDGWKSPVEKIKECRYLRGLNFMAIADHDFDQTEDKWKYYQDLARKSNENQFCCFLANEWTPSFGFNEPLKRQIYAGWHYVVLSTKFNTPIFSAENSKYDTIEKLFKEAEKNKDVLIIPHFHGGMPPPHKLLSPVAEIAAWDGKIAEKSGSHPQKGIFDYLNEGAKLGIIAGVDHGGEGLTLNRNGECFGVLCDKFDNMSIIQSINSRKTFANQKYRALLNFELTSGGKMGEQIITDKEVLEFKVKVAADPYPVSISLIRNGEILTKVPTTNASKNIWEMHLADAKTISGDNWYMVKIELCGGKFVWSSPIWVNNNLKP